MILLGSCCLNKDSIFLQVSKRFLSQSKNTSRLIEHPKLTTGINVRVIGSLSLNTFPRSSWRPRTWAAKTPVPIKILGTRPRKPRRFLGAISPKYIGTTLREMPAWGRKKKSLITHYFLPVWEEACTAWLPEWIPVMKRPMMTISGEPQILLKPMSEPAINTSTVEFTTVPFLHKHTHTQWLKIHFKYI